MTEQQYKPMLTSKHKTWSQTRNRGQEDPEWTCKDNAEQITEGFLPLTLVLQVVGNLGKIQGRQQKGPTAPRHNRNPVICQQTHPDSVDKKVQGSRNPHNVVAINQVKQDNLQGQETNDPALAEGPNVTPATRQVAMIKGLTTYRPKSPSQPNQLKWKAVWQRKRTASQKPNMAKQQPDKQPIIENNEIPQDVISPNLTGYRNRLTGWITGKHGETAPRKPDRKQILTRN